MPTGSRVACPPRVRAGGWTASPGTRREMKTWPVLQGTVAACPVAPLPRCATHSEAGAGQGRVEHLRGEGPVQDGPHIVADQDSGDVSCAHRGEKRRVRVRLRVQAEKHAAERSGIKRVLRRLQGRYAKHRPGRPRLQRIGDVGRLDRVVRDDENGLVRCHARRCSSCRSYQGAGYQPRPMSKLNHDIRRP